MHIECVSAELSSHDSTDGEGDTSEENDSFFDGMFEDAVLHESDISNENELDDASDASQVDNADESDVSNENELDDASDEIFFCASQVDNADESDVSNENELDDASDEIFFLCFAGGQC